METGWQREFAVFKCEAAANSVTGHVCVNSNKCYGIREDVRNLLVVLPHRILYNR